MQASNRSRTIVAAVVIVLVAATLIGATVWTPAKDTSNVTPAAPIGSLPPMVGTLTGASDNGVPVYRLPSITISASRSAELAKMAPEEQVATK